MQSDTPPMDGHPDPRDGAAAIAPVTEAMMDHAAHEAAALADAAARGTVAPEQAAQGTADLSERSAVPADAAVRPPVDAPGEAVRLGQAAAEDMDRAVAHGTEAASEALSASADAMGQYNAKVMEIMRSNLASTTELFAALVQAKSVPEAMSLNADHLRRRMETLTGQGRDLATLAQRIALDALQPFKGADDR